MTLPSLGVTYFDDYAAVRKNERQISLEQLAEQIRSANAAEKDALPWLKLARFGNATTEHGSLRHDRNVISVTGCEVDYDGEQVGLDAAIEALEKAGVQAIAYTTPSFARKRRAGACSVPSAGIWPRRCERRWSIGSMGC